MGAISIASLLLWLLLELMAAQAVSQIPASASGGGLTPPLRLNEVLIDNRSTISDQAGDFDSWAELYNAGLLPLDVGGMALSNDALSPTQWLIPTGTVIPGRDYLLIWVDGEPQEGALHTNFTLTRGQYVKLFDKQLFDGELVDQFFVGVSPPDWSWARRPDGHGVWTLFERPSPAALNAVSWVYLPGLARTSDEPQVEVVINELMAANDSTIADEVGEYDDWIELYNPGPEDLDVGRMYLSDDLGNLPRWQIPAGTVISAGGYLLFWADGEPDQGPLHTNFRLSRDGEMVTLVKADGYSLLDWIVFPAQQDDVSFGRLPDGANDWRSFVIPTPGGPNGATSSYVSVTTGQACAVHSNDSLSLPHAVHLPFVIRQRPPYEMRINVGGPAYTTTQGELYLADRPYTPMTGAGYVYPGRVIEWYNVLAHPMGGTRDKWLYADARADFGEYRFDLPPDDYLVTLQWAALYSHAPGQRVFDVFVESSRVLTDFDIFAEANLWYAIDVPVSVVVTDGQLNVLFSPTVASPVLNAITVIGQDQEPVTPTRPLDVQAVGCYDRILFDWSANAEPDQRGYQVRRTVNRSAVLPTVTSPLQLVPYYLDDDVELGQIYSYTARALNAAGQVSDASGEVTATILPLTSTALPVYELIVAPEYLAQLDADPWSEEYVPAVWRHAGVEYDVGVRYRGGWTSRYAPKKSWKVRFPEAQLFQGHRFLNLNAEFNDRYLVKEKFAYDLFHLFGVDGPEAGLVHLRLNGQFWGVYTQVEHVDEYFLLRSGRPVGSSIYKVEGGGDFSLHDNPADYAQIYQKRTNLQSGYDELIALLELVNNTPDDQFPQALVQVFEVAAYLNYYATVMLTANTDVTVANYYLVHNPETGRWEVLPWDNGSTLWWQTMPIDYGTPTNILLTRVLDVPEFRLYYGRYLIEAMDDEYSPAQVGLTVDGYRGLVGHDGTCDVWHRYWWSRDFDPDVTPFVEQRNAYLQAVVYSYTAGLTLPLALELTPAGDRLVLYNHGLLDWDVSGMTVRTDYTTGAGWTLPEGTVVPAGEFLVLWDAQSATTSLVPAPADAWAGIERIELLDKPVHSTQLVAPWVRKHTRRNPE